MDKELWIKGLKPGDKVAVQKSSGAHKYYDIQPVKNITKGGKVRLTNGELYDKEGYRKFDTWDLYSYCIVQITEEVRTELLRKRVLSKVQKTEFYNMDLEKLTVIFKIINESSTKNDEEFDAVEEKRM